jgi:hypothetical protein
MSDLRRCIGSTKFGIEAHDAPVTDFPVQPSQKDGLGRMCKPHWNQYTTALRKAALARKAAEAQVAPPPEVAEAKPAVSASKRRAPKPAAAKARTAKAVVELAPDAAPSAEA